MLGSLDNYKLHSRKDEDEKNLVSKKAVVKGVLLQQAVQAVVATILFAHLEEDFGPLLKETKKLLDEYDNLVVKLNHEYELQEDHYRKDQQEVDILINMFSTIKENDNNCKGDRLKALQEKQSQSEFELNNCGTRLVELMKELEKSRDLCRSQAELRCNIEENLEYRKVKAQVDDLTQEIESLEESVLKIGGVSKIESVLLKHSQERESLLTELNRHRGTLSVYRSNIDSNRADLRQTQYKDIDKRYFDQLIQLKTTEMANKDLDRYYKALDKPHCNLIVSNVAFSCCDT